MLIVLSSFYSLLLQRTDEPESSFTHAAQLCCQHCVGDMSWYNIFFYKHPFFKHVVVNVAVRILGSRIWIAEMIITMSKRYSTFASTMLSTSRQTSLSDILTVATKLTWCEQNTETKLLATKLMLSTVSDGINRDSLLL